jgi:thiol-disulfide isomerase/thioredoxin
MPYDVYRTAGIESAAASRTGGSAVIWKVCSVRPALAAVCAMALALQSFAQEIEIEEPSGKDMRLPEIGGKDLLTGKAVSLAGLKGHVVVVDLWATWCAPCVKEMPEMVKFQEKHKGRKFTYIGVSVDEAESVEQVKAVAKRLKVNYPVLMAEPSLLRMLGEVMGRPLRGIPAKFAVRRDGVLAFFVEGSPLVLPEIEKEYLKRLGELLKAPIPASEERQETKRT